MVKLGIFFILLSFPHKYKEKGANEQYKKNLENNETQALYRRIYRQKFMIAQRNKDSKDFHYYNSEKKKTIVINIATDDK